MVLWWAENQVRFRHLGWDVFSSAWPGAGPHQRTEAAGTAVW